MAHEEPDRAEADAVTRFVLDLDGADERVLIRLLRALLKRLGRDHGVRCTAVVEASSKP